MLAVMLLCGGCIIGVPIGIISDEFTKLVESADEESKEEDDKKDLFEEFSKELTDEQKLEIIARYHKEKEDVSKETKD